MPPTPCVDESAPYDATPFRRFERRAPLKRTEGDIEAIDVVPWRSSCDGLLKEVEVRLLSGVPWLLEGESSRTQSGLGLPFISVGRVSRGAKREGGGSLLSPMITGAAICVDEPQPMAVASRAPNRLFAGPGLAWLPLVARRFEAAGARAETSACGPGRITRISDFLGVSVYSVSEIG